MKEKRNIYQGKFVTELFDSMSGTYGITNYISSFGFTKRWRRQCIQLLPEKEEFSQGFDLMSGQSELADSLRLRLKPGALLTAIDFSSVMLSLAAKSISKYDFTIKLQQTDVLEGNLGFETADFVVSAFGLKTFNSNQQRILAQRVAKLLRPGGVFSFVEVSKPRSWVLRYPYFFYINFIIPMLGWLFRGNAADYRMLGEYTWHFGNCRFFSDRLVEQGLQVKYKNLFFGCASAVYGFKPVSV